MYVTVGGRGSQSALYRIRYAGAEATDPVEVRASSGEEARRTRRALEAFHGRVDADVVAAAWPHMDSRTASSASPRASRWRTSPRRRGARAPSPRSGRA